MSYDTGLAQALEDAGLDVVVYTGWPSRGDPGLSPHGFVWHHTGPWSSIEAIVQLCIHGRPDLAGPLCQFLIDPLGTCHVIAAGKANHAGPGGWHGLSGNHSVYGCEAIHSGDPRTPWPTVQVDAMVTAAGALARHAGFGADACCGHREWAPRRKVDPVALDLEGMRMRVAAQLTAWATPTAAPRLPATISEVRPMYDPPIGPVAAVWQRDGTHDVIAAASPDGYVYAWGCPWAGNVAGRSWWGTRKVAMIGPRPDGAAGYRVTATSGETYDLPSDIP